MDERTLLMARLRARPAGMGSGPRHIHARSLALLASAFLACDRADEGGARRSECNRFCESLEKCDDATDLLDCQNQCEDDDVRSDRYYTARADCANKLSCSRWMREVSNRGEDVCNEGCNLNDCVDDTLGQVKLSEDEQNACMALSTKVKACKPSLDTLEIKTACEDVIPALSDAYREDSERCSEQECGQMASCIDKLSDHHQTKLKLYSF